MAKLPLRNSNKLVIVDQEDYPVLSRHKWFLSKTGYPVANIGYGRKNRRSVTLHSLILGPIGKNLIYDHINRNKLDNRKINLRAVSFKQNSWNISKTSKSTTSKYLGVHLHKKTGKWRARIYDGRKSIHLGLYSTETNAARAYDEMAHMLRGIYATTNFRRVKI